MRQRAEACHDFLGGAALDENFSNSLDGLPSGVLWRLNLGGLGRHHVHKALFNAACYEPETINVEKLLLEGLWEIDGGYSTSSAYKALIDRVNPILHFL